VPLCAPASPEQYQRAKALLLDGLTLWEALGEVHCNRQALVERSYADGDWHGWQAAEESNKAAVSARIAGEALKAGVAQARTTETSEEGPQGLKTTRKTERSAEIAALRLAGEHIDPERHGKAASRSGPLVQIGVQVSDARAVLLDVATYGPDGAAGSMRLSLPPDDASPPSTTQ